MSDVVQFPAPAHSTTACHEQPVRDARATSPDWVSNGVVPSRGDSGLFRALASINRLGWIAAAECIRNDEAREQALTQIEKGLGLL